MIWYLLHKCPLVLLQHYQTKMKKTNHFPSLHMHVNGKYLKKGNATTSDLRIEKHVYGRIRKHATNPISDFDPRLSQFHGTLRIHLPEFFRESERIGDFPHC